MTNILAGGCIAAVCLFAEARLLAPSDGPHFVRIVILDVSRSMKGDNIRVAREELLDAARQLAPSEKYPFVVIPFNSTVDKVHRFVEFSELEKYLKTITPGGGTSIAAGLERAVSEVTGNHDIRHVCIFMYTDGEDKDMAGIQAQESRLDAMFAEREKRGLKQTIVFCKRWKGVCASLVASLRAHGHAHFVDAGELQLTPLTLIPRFAVESASWSNETAGELQVRVSGAIDIRGKRRDVRLEPVMVACTMPDVKGDLHVGVRPGDRDGVSINLRVPTGVSVSHVPKHMDVAFRIDEPGEVTVDGGLVLPLLPIDAVTVVVDVPAVRIDTQLTGRLLLGGNPRWSESVEGAVLVVADVHLAVACVPAWSWTKALPFRLVPGSNQVIVAGSERISMSEPGSTGVQCEIQLSPIGRGTANEKRYVELTIEPSGAPSEFAFTPSQLVLGEEVASPSVEVVTITTALRRVLPSKWVDINSGVASVTALIDVLVDGLCPNDAEMSVAYDAPVGRVELEPRMLQAGSQTVSLDVLYAPGRSSNTESFAFRFIPPASRHSREFVSEEILRVPVKNPAAPQVALADGQSVPRYFQLRLPNGAESTSFSVMPVVIGMSEVAAAENLIVSVRCHEPLQLSGQRLLLRPYLPAKVDIFPPAQATRSWFVDDRYTADVEVAPEGEESVVRGSRQRLILTVEARFKHTILWCVLGVVLVASYLVVHRFTRMGKNRAL